MLFIVSLLCKAMSITLGFLQTEQGQRLLQQESSFLRLESSSYEKQSQEMSKALRSHIFQRAFDGVLTGATYDLDIRKLH